MPRHNLPLTEEIREIHQEEKQQLLNEMTILNTEVETFEQDFMDYCNDESVSPTGKAYERAKRLSDESKELKNKLNNFENKLFSSRFDNAELNKMLEDNQGLKNKVEFLGYKLEKNLTKSGN